MSNIKKSTLQVIDAYKTAVFEKNVDAFINLYSEDVWVFDAWSAWSYDNLESWRKMVDEWFISLGNERVKVNFEEVRAIDGQELTIVTSIVTYAGYSAEGENLHVLQNRLTWTLKPEGNAVRIVHEHTSVPVGFNDKKAILLRETQSCPAK
ncbi:MAG: nuclear transport factor 2 family protein [Methylobacter sp.]|uniref:YybH family protein n=1 Tax=Methylobacter sp. TaxID=2051955 RepID=UPI00258DBCBF|nr:nuclear transport factor 2 family protein [Methylobacter sp.]MCL7419888.1 nuclear transport factor 2 family protein [Methylobacter sp.]